ncbi:hypothetical protein EYS14_06770 [Alteromonadaceae bacterium M269]|nr:hypothetical protein EYS14_06770 [Alteromonadaceae bacterium M269]
MKIINITLLSVFLCGLVTKASATVVEASPEHYVLKQEAESTLKPEKLWQRLIKPESWWHPDHTYSGDSANLSLDLTAGGLWSETWDGGSVLHGQVLLVMNNKQLRLNAPFGPLQEKAVQVIWTITLTPSDKGTLVVFDEVASGSQSSELDKLAPAVDFVKTEAIKRLVNIN